MQAASPVVLGYYADWTKDFTPDRIGWPLFTHIAHAFAGASPDGDLAIPERGVELCGRARDAKVKTLLSLGGVDSNKALTAATATPDKAMRFVDQLARHMDKVGYDGVDVDWEAHEGAADRDHLTELVRRLRQRLGPDRLITMAVPMSHWGGQWFDDALKPLVDRLHVMTYDMHGPWSDHAGHNAPLLPVAADKSDGAALSYASGLEYWTKRGWPKEKLALGIPCYGRGFVARGWYDPTDKTKKPKYAEVAYKEAVTLMANGWKSQYDTAAHVPFLISPDGRERISYEDPDSAAEKGAWCRTQGVSGIFFWEISQDAVRGTHMIVSAARLAFRESPKKK